jgi:GNAT superfamily N-acetyltransferase
MHIRQATADDAAALAELSSQFGYSASEQQVLERLGAMRESNEHLVLVACLDDGQIAGWIHVFLAHRVESDCFAELGGFVVDRQHRRGGIGRLLLDQAEEWAVGRGAHRLRVRSRTARQEVHGFFKRLGFAPAKEQLVLDKQLDGD